MIHHLIILSDMASPAYSDEDPYGSSFIPLIHSTNFLTMISTLSRESGTMVRSGSSFLQGPGNNFFFYC